MTKAASRKTWGAYTAEAERFRAYRRMRPRDAQADAIRRRRATRATGMTVANTRGHTRPT